MLQKGKRENIFLFKKRNDHLEGRGLERVLVLETVGDQLAFAHVVQPVQLPPRVLAPVECSEPGGNRGYNMLTRQHPGSPL